MYKGEPCWLSLKHLHVSPKNPRYPDTVTIRDEAEAIAELIRIVEPKRMLNLARHIVEYGLDPTVLPIAWPKDDRPEHYWLLDGNRRIAILKMFADSSLAEQAWPNKYWRDRFNEISSQYIEQGLMEEVLCYVPQTLEEGLEWVRIRHTATKDGVGTLHWDKHSKDRLRRKYGMYTLGLHVVELLKKHGLLDEKTALKVVLSNVERVLEDPYISAMIGVSVSRGKVTIEGDEARALAALQRIALDTVEKDPATGKKFLTSRNTNNKAQRKEYAERLIERLEARQTVEKQAKPRPQGEVVDSSSDKAASFVPSAPVTAAHRAQIPRYDPTRRKVLATSGLRVLLPRLKAIYRELLKLEVAQYRNACAVLLRVFLEGSVDYFIETHQDEFPNLAKELQRASYEKTRGPSLRNKVQKIVGWMEKEGLLSRNEAKPIHVAMRDQHDIASIDTFNAYVHNMQFSPDPDRLKQAWNNFLPLFQQIWRKQ